MTGRVCGFSLAKRFAFGGLAMTMLVSVAGCAGGPIGDFPNFTEDAFSKSNQTRNIAELKSPGPLPEKSLGKPDAPVTMIEYASLGCPICGVFHKSTFPQFKKAYIDSGKVYYIYREFPIGKSPAAAAHAARCVADKSYFHVNDKFMANKSQWNGRDPNPDLLYKIVQETGITRAAFDTCMANQKIDEGITWVKQRGREFGVKGTPTFFINGQQVRGGMNYEELRKVIEQHLQGAAKPA
jgi:protein-disulfide isomerase